MIFTLLNIYSKNCKQCTVMKFVECKHVSIVMYLISVWAPLWLYTCQNDNHSHSKHWRTYAC